MEKLLPHEEYDRANNLNDIGLVRLASPVNYSRRIAPVCLNSKEIEKSVVYFGPIKAYALGWGIAREDMKKQSMVIIKYEY